MLCEHSSAFPDPTMAEAAEKISGVLREYGLGGAVIIISPTQGGLLVLEPKTLESTEYNDPEAAVDYIKKHGHFVLCLNAISSTVQQHSHQELERLGAFGTPKDTTLN